MSRLFTVARFEFLTNVRRWEFLVLTLGLPIFSGFLILLTTLPTLKYLSDKMGRSEMTQIGYVDQSGRLTFPREVAAPEAPPVQVGHLDDPFTAVPQGPSSFRMTPYTSENAARQDLVDGKIAVLYVIHPDYLKSGNVDVISVSKGFFHNERFPPMRALLLENLLKGRLDPMLFHRVVEPMEANRILLTSKGQVIDSPFRQDVSDFFLPYGMMLLLLLSLVGSSSYLLRSVSEEKENRIMEILLSSVSPADLFYGKILGLGLLGMVQVGFWLLISVPVLVLVLHFVSVSAAGVGLFLIYFVMGYMLHAGIIAGVGAVGSTEKESNQITSLFFLLSVSPMTVLPIILDDISGPVARIFSLFPFTAPMVMMVRLMRQAPPIGDIALSLGIMALSILVVYRVSLKVFRMGLLMYGKTPNFREIITWMSQA